MIYPANKPELPPLPKTRPTRWRMRSAARVGALVGLAGAVIQGMNLNHGLSYADIAVDPLVGALLAVAFAAARNRLLPRDAGYMPTKIG